MSTEINYLPENLKHYLDLPKKEPSTLSSFHQLDIENVDLNLDINFEKKTLSGYTTFTVSKKKELSEEIKSIDLDTSFLDIFECFINKKQVNNFIVNARTGNEGALGSKLSVPLVQNGDDEFLQLVNSGAKIDLKVKYSTTEKSTALIWLDSEQSGDTPYVYAQLEPIHCRSMFPSFDTPAVKCSYTATIRSPQYVCFSGVPLSIDEKNGVYKFKQDYVMSTYLIALVSGNIKSGTIGPRSKIYTQPSMLNNCIKQFEPDMELILKTCEEYLGYRHPLDEISLTVLPKSFGYGGIETNSVIMLTPTILNSDFDVEGDKKFTTKETIEFNTVLIHEIIHTISSGNYVTNFNWGEMFLNEGWTVYLERKILARVLGGSGYDELTDEIIGFENINGWNSLKETVATFDNPERFTKLLQDYSDEINPDDGFSSIFYEKGCFLLFFLENFVGGAEKFDPYVRYYFSTFKYKSISIWQFVNSIYEFYHSYDKDIFNKLTKEMDWDLWLLTPGLPPTPKFNTKRADEVTKLAEAWINKAKFEISGDKDTKLSTSADSVDEFSVQQLLLFIDTLCDFKHWAEAGETSLEFINLYTQKFESLFNYPEFEYRYIRWLSLTKISLDTTTERLIKFVSDIGRMKYVRPLFLVLAKINKTLAIETYEKLHGFYSNVCAEMVKKDLGI
ncbi:hypothetical protein QEN19_000737 [Hanseniaspora menglaensis]